MKKDLHYSGPKSVKFWKRINNKKFEEGEGYVLYAMGCVLQDLEEKLINELTAAEQRVLGRKLYK